MSDARRRFDEHGFFVRADAIEGSACDAALAEVGQAWAARRAEAERKTLPRDNGFARVQVRPELQRLHRDHPALAALCHHPLLLDVARDLIGDDVDVVWNQAHAKAGGAHAQTTIPWHQDAAFVELERGPLISCWIALTEVTLAHGPLLIGRSSQREILPHGWNEALAYYICPKPADVVAVPLARGRVVVFDWRVVHGSGMNRTQRARVGYSVTFGPRQVRLKKNGELFGDQVPALREGQSVRRALADAARTGAASDAIAKRALADLGDRIDQARIDAAFSACVDSARLGKPLDISVMRLLGLGAADDLVNGDLLRSRTDVPSILREVSTLHGRDRTVARRLLERAMEIEPHNDEVLATLATLEAATAPAKG